MILYWYIHWFWITILIVYTSVAEKQEQQESMTTHSISNDSTLTIMDQNVPNTTKTLLNRTTTIPPIVSVNASVNVSTTSKSTWNISSEQIQNDNTNMSVSVIEANVTSTASFSLNGEHENLTTLESSYKESDNESIRAASDRMASATGGQLSAAGITSITVGCVVLVAIVSGVSYLWYRNRSFNRPQVLSDRCSNLDSSGYIDDTSVRDNSEEMYSLDNDSFLNSLEAMTNMTIQNYWTDTVKHTKL